MPVKIRTLDGLLSEGARLPEIVKSDTQGSEGQILKGAAGLLAKGWRPIWLLEFWPFGLRNSGTDPTEMVESLRSLGYCVFEIMEQKARLAEIDADILSRRVSSDLHPDTGHFINLLAIPEGSEGLDEVKDLL